MSVVEDKIILENILELRKLLNSTDGKLIKSKITPEDYFMNLSHKAPKLDFPDVGISKIIVNVCELISTLLLEDVDESSSVSKVIVMIFEYYFLVAPRLFQNQGAILVNDVTFMKHFMGYIKSLCNSRRGAQRELGNTLVAIDLYSPIIDFNCT